MQIQTMKKDARFWDNLAERYAKKPVDDEAAYQKKLKVTRDYLSPDSEVLEFGCGTGSTALYHAPVVKSILATDISAKMIEIAKRKASDANVANVEFRQSTLEALGLADNSYDVVLGLSILHLLKDKEAAIREVYRVLKPGGVFVSSTVCLGDSMRYFRFIAPIGKFFRLLPVLRTFRSSELETSLTDTGFGIDYKWKPNEKRSAFIIARKAASPNIKSTS